MPRISWLNLPLPIRQHLIDRMHDRKITKDDLAQLMLWIASNPEVPEGPWFKDFRSFKLCGHGDRTALRPGPGAAGHQTRRGLQSIFTDSTLRVSLVRVPVTRALMALAVFPVRQ